jgi:O-antigen/teichoic acid export membrane protein
LGAANFGIYSVLLNLVVLFSIIDFGANLGIIRKMIHQNTESKKLVPTLFYFYLLLSVLLVPVIYGYLFYSVHWNENNIVYALVIGAIIVCNISSILFDSVLQSLHVIYLTKLIRSFKTIVEFLGWIYFIKQGSISYLLLVSLLVNIVYIFILYRAVQKRFSFSLSFSAFSFTALKNHIRYSIWYFIAAVAVVLIYNMQIVLFNQYTSTILVAHFFIVTKFYEIIRVAVSNFSQVLYPKIIQMEASQNWVGIRKMYFSSIMKAFFLTAIIALIIINFGDFVFIKWSKLSDEATLQLFHYYLFFILLVIIDNVSVIYLAALKLNAVPTIVSFCQGILSVVFTYLLINKYGLMGAFYASIASFIITNMLFNPFYLLQKIKARSFNPIA